MRGLGAVVKNVTEVSIAFGARDRSANHAESGVANLRHVFGSNRRPETGPSGTRFELGGGIEERIFAANATVNAGVVQVPIFSGEGDFGVGVAGDIEDSGG